jgi:predicted acylesterase/phospholipase RssA
VSESLSQRFQTLRPFEEMELALARAVVATPHLLDGREEALLRLALSLSRLYSVRHQGEEYPVEGWLAGFRDQVMRRLGPLLLSSRPLTRDRIAPQAWELREPTLRAREDLVHHLAAHVPAEALYRELYNKSLVLVAGGGGGVGYVYLGVMSLLDEHGLRPAMLAGTSIGAIISLMRSRLAHFDTSEAMSIIRSLSFRKLFRFISTESRYGLPAALRLFLRAGLGRYFHAGLHSPHSGMLLKDLPVPTLVTVAGIRRGKLPHSLEYYERLLGTNPRSLLNPLGLARRFQSAMGAIAELLSRPDVLVPIHLGPGAELPDFDALDAAGFSSALPGVIHYDVLREDPHMRGLLDGLFEQRGIFRLIDGGLADNLPVQAAWRAVHQGHLGTRNAFFLALDGFAPRLSTPFWLPLQRLAAMTVAPNLPYAHLVKRFSPTLSPLEVVPSVDLAAKALQYGRNQFVADMPLLTRMLAPLPHLQ